jgi:hypothetical protein
MLACASTSSYPQRRRARVIHTPCASTSSTPAVRALRLQYRTTDDGGSRRAGVAVFGAFRVADDDGAAERRCVWMIGEAVCELEGNAIASTRSRARPGSRGRSSTTVGVFRRMLMPSEEEIATSTGTSCSSLSRAFSIVVKNP